MSGEKRDANLARMQPQGIQTGEAGSADSALQAPACPVNSHNEWDPLEEVIVGRLEGACFAAWRRINQFTVPPGDWDRIESAAGRVGGLYPADLLGPAQRCLDGFIRLLEAEGVVVRRPEPARHERPFATGDWSVSTGFGTANPRDPFDYIPDYDRVPAEFALTEEEPVFDAADLVRCGRDIFIPRSTSTRRACRRSSGTGIS